MDIYRGRVGTSRGGPTPPSGKVPHPTPPGASPPRPLRPGQVAGAQGGARALFEGNLGPSLSRLSGRGKGRASVSWRSSGWRLVVLPLGTPRNPGDHHKPSPFWMVERRERGSEFALSGVRSTLLGSSSSSEGGGVARVKGDVSSGRMLRSRASAGAACWRASERDEQGGACCLSVFRSGMVPDGGCSPEGVGRVCRSDQRGCSVPWWKRRGGLWGAPSGGHRACCSLSLPGGRTPPGAAQTPRHLQRHCKRASAGGSADCIRA